MTVSKSKKYIYFYISILKDFGISVTEGFLLLLINSLSRQSKTCYASKNYLAKILNVSESTIFFLINKLIKKGLLIKDGYSKHGTSQYKPSEEVAEYMEKLREIDLD